MSADDLIARLDGVRRTSTGRWICRCPAHGDKSPSLSIRELDDGRTLLHCFAGCEVEAILVAVDLKFDCLFPEKICSDVVKGERRPFNAIDALRCIASEAVLIAVAASNVAQKMPMTEAEISRLHTAAGRINHALEVALG